MARGTYRASFRLRREPGTGAGRPATVAVTAARGRVLIATRAVHGDDLADDRYRDVSLDFRLEARMAELEWPVRLEPSAALYVDRITITVLGLDLI